MRKILPSCRCGQKEQFVPHQPHYGVVLRSTDLLPFLYVFGTVLQSKRAPMLSETRAKPEPILTRRHSWDLSLWEAMNVLRTLHHMLSPTSETFSTGYFTMARGPERRLAPPLHPDQWEGAPRRRIFVQRHPTPASELTTVQPPVGREMIHIR